MTGLPALLRIARRDARRDRWRTLLIVVIVALPVAGLGTAVAAFDTMNATPEERVRDRFGSADAVVMPGELPDGVEPLADLAARLPAGTILEPHSYGVDRVVVPGERPQVSLTDVPLTDGALAADRYRLVDGHAPTAAGEVAATEALAELFELEVGSTVTLVEHGEATVVGILRRREFLGERQLVVAPGTLTEPVLGDVLVRLPPDVSTGVLDFLATPPMAVDEGAEPPWHGMLRADELSYRFTGGERWFMTIVGGLAVVEVALIAGASFAVSVRRRQRELGLVAAVGGTTRQVRRIVLLTGATAGAVGAAVGGALAVVAAMAAVPWMQQVAQREITAVRLDPWWLVPVAVVGVLSAVLGAWWPARAVARLPVTVALSGRRPAPQPSVRGLRAGVGLAAVGALVTFVGATVFRTSDATIFLLGSVLLVLGVGLTSPWLLERLGRIAPRLPAGPRLAIRDAARFRTRNGPIVTAAMAGLAACVTVAAVIGSLDTAYAARYQPSLPRDVLVVHAEQPGRVASAIAADLGGSAVPVKYAAIGVEVMDGPEAGPLFGGVAVGSPELARLLGGEPAVEALAAGQVVLLGRQATAVGLTSGNMHLDMPASDVVVEVREAAALPSPGGIDPSRSILPLALVPPGVLRDVETFSDTALVGLHGPIDDRQYEAAVALAGGGRQEAFVTAERGYRSPYAGMLTAALAVGTTAGLVVVGIAIALAATEARADLRTLTAVGAARRTRRSLAAGRALLLAGLGGVLAVPVGLVPAAAVVLGATDAAFSVPWPTIGLVAVAVPAAATLGAVLFGSRAPDPIARTAT